MKIRVVTVVKDEIEFLPVFLRHYDRFCDSIVIWDNGSSDGTLEIARAHPKVDLRAFKSEGFDMEAVFSVLHEARKESIGKFDWCLFPDCDELIMSRKPGSERKILENAVEQVLIPQGYCLVQKDAAPSFDPSKDPLFQCRWGHRSKDGDLFGYSKPIIMRPEIDIKWKPGRHGATLEAGCSTRKADDLILIHLDQVDFRLWLKRKMRPISPNDRKNGWGVLRWDLPRKEYDALWKRLSEGAIDLDDELPGSLTA